MILDTNALSAFLAKAPAIEGILRRASAFCIPVIVLGEYRYGLRASKQQKILEEQLGALIVDAQVLTIDETTTRRYADVRSELKAAGTPIPENDIWIAALVRQHGLPLLTRDLHFDFVPGMTRVSW